MSAPAVRSGQALPVGRRGRRRAPARPRAPVPRPAAARIALLAAGAGLGATTALTFTAETASQLCTRWQRAGHGRLHLRQLTAAARGGRGPGNLTAVTGITPCDEGNRL